MELGRGVGHQVRDPDGEDRGSKFTAEDVGEVRSRAVIGDKSFSVHGWQRMMQTWKNIITHRVQGPAWFHCEDSYFSPPVPPLSSVSETNAHQVQRAGDRF